MPGRGKPPGGLTDFQGKPARVTVTRESGNGADSIVTKGFIDLYTQPDGFHCPRCSAVITSYDEAVSHMADEMNKALDLLGKKAD